MASALCPPGPLTCRLTQLSLELRCSFEWALDSVHSQDVAAFCVAQAGDTAPVLCTLSLSLSVPSFFSSGLSGVETGRCTLPSHLGPKLRASRATENNLILRRPFPHELTNALIYLAIYM